MDRQQLYYRYEAIFEGVQAPFAFVDLDALERNGHEMVGRAAGKPIRVASKSVRCRAVLDRIPRIDPSYKGLLCFTLPEALWLAELGYRDLVVAYPTVDRDALATLNRLAASDPDAAPTVMVDDIPQLDRIEGAASNGGGSNPVPVAIDIDVSWRPTGRRGMAIGPKRSPVRTVEDAVSLAQEIIARPGVRLAGLMAYEGHVAGVGDDTPGQAAKNLAIRRMQAASRRDYEGRRAEIAAAIGELQPDLGFFNAGGTGSLHLTSAESAVTELTAGSGFYAPALFDNYRGFDLEPAAFFALPCVRRPDPGSITALGGGYLASGTASPDRLPIPWLPEGLSLDANEGAGEVQTPLLGPAANSLRIGNRVYMRHAKAGELCERFNSLYLVQGEQIVEEAPTYRGEGKAFL